MKAKHLTVGILTAAVSLTALTGCQNLVKNDPAVCTVIDKDRSTETVDGTSKSVFRIYTEGCGEDNATLGLADNFIAGNFNASDMYGRIKVGKTYEFQTVGIRNGYFSSFREITKMREVTDPSPSTAP
jgi:hypothetical protein